jgi:twinkle protein
MSTETQTRGLSDKHLAQIEERGLDTEVAVRMGLHSVPSKNGGGELCVIPFYREGKIANRKYRTDLTQGSSSGKMWQDKGVEKLCFNEDCLRDDSLLGHPLVITEGEFDALAAIECGFPRTISVPEGAPAQAVGDVESAKYAWLDPIRDLLSFERCPEIILAVDGDSAGAALLHDLSIRLMKARCKFVTYPITKWDRGRQRCKDLNEVLHEYGHKGVKEVIARAQWTRLDGIYRMGELPPVPAPMSYDIGVPVLRNHYRVRLGDLSVVTGIPSHGKTSVVNDLCCRLVFNHNLTVAFASFEQSPQRDHRRNLRTWYNKAPVISQSDDQIAMADQWIDRHFSFIVPSDEDDVTLDWALDKAEAAVIRHGAKIVVFDPWNEMDHVRERGESLTEYVGRAIKTFKRFARRLQVHLIIVAHPSKQMRKEDGSFAVPTLYDISDSANWYNKADVGLVVHRTMVKDTSDNLVPGPTLIRVQKSRYHDEIGTPGDVLADFHADSRRYDVIEKEAA